MLKSALGVVWYVRLPPHHTRYMLIYRKSGYMFIWQNWVTEIWPEKHQSSLGVVWYVHIVPHYTRYMLTYRWSGYMFIWLDLNGEEGDSWSPSCPNVSNPVISADIPHFTLTTSRIIHSSETTVFYHQSPTPLTQHPWEENHPHNSGGNWSPDFAFAKWTYKHFAYK